MNISDNEPLTCVPLSVLTERTSLRDQMAMAALTGLLCTLASSRPDFDKNMFCNVAYQYADAMLEEREKK